jgi:hypothetical protein
MYVIALESGICLDSGPEPDCERPFVLWSVSVRPVRQPGVKPCDWRKGADEMRSAGETGMVGGPMGVLHVDCENCVACGDACGDCVISVLLGAPDHIDLDAAERSALSALADQGLVPPLRLIPGAKLGRSLDAPPGWQDYA